MLVINIITAYPEMFPGILKHSLIGKSLKEKKWTLNVVNLHDFGKNKRKSIDDSPFGGGPGMILKPDVVEKAVLSILNNNKKKIRLIYMTPTGKPLNQKILTKFAKTKDLIILCGRFEGVDERVINSLGFERISIGDYILTGGEIAAQVLVEGCVRLLPGVLGRFESTSEESFSDDLLEYPHYTRPQVWSDSSGLKHAVPEILISGDHKKIKQWREKQSIELTKKLRPDLLKKIKKR